MENKKMYTYQFSLNDGTVQIYSCEGLFSSINEDTDKKLLINSAVIIDSFMVDKDGNKITEDDAVPVSDYLEVVEQAEEVVVEPKKFASNKKRKNK